MEESDERDKLQQDIQQIHQVLSADEGGSSDDDDDVEILEEAFTPGDDLQIVETNVATDNETEKGAEDGFEQQQQPQSSPIEALLIRNREYQQLIETLLHQVQQALENNQREQKEVETRVLAVGGQNYDGLPINKKPAARAMVSFFKPYFRDDNGNVPPPNTEAIERKALQQDPFIMPRSAWNNQEIKSLKEGVRNDRLRRIQQPLWNRRELLQDKLTNPKLDDDEKDGLQEQIDALDESIARSHTSKGTESDPGGLSDIDWMRISSMDLDGERSPLECKLQWEVLMRPDINNTKWTSSEEEKLLKLVDKHQERDWAAIASELASGRTAFQCIQHYRRNLCNNLCKKYFTPEEDEKMMELIEKFRVGNYIPYIKVSYYMEGHSHKQVCMHWSATLNPDIRTGRWSKAEDELLRQAVSRYGAKNWAKIADEVPGRTFMQVRDRWCLHIAPTVKRGSWGPKEDLKMIELIIKHGLVMDGAALNLPNLDDPRGHVIEAQEVRTANETVDATDMTDTIHQGSGPRKKKRACM